MVSARTTSRGRIVRFDSPNGIGEIRSHEGMRISFRARDVISGERYLAPGSSVSFEMLASPEGPAATHIRVTPRMATDPRTFFSIAAVALTGIFAALLVGYATLPPLWVYAIAVNGAVFTLCGFDKRGAESSGPRVPERTLLIWAALGGSAGLLLAMSVFRHKTRKPRFQLWVSLIIAAQCGCLRLLELLRN